MKFADKTLHQSGPAILLTTCILSLFMVSCQKNNDNINPPPADPSIRYSDLKNLKLKFGQSKSIDLNGDGVTDIRFSTMGVGDPLLRQDKHQYYLNGMFDTYSLVNEHEESPVLQQGDSIHAYNPDGYEWYNASAVILAEKVIPETGTTYWRGNWKNADHKYFPLRVKKADGSYQAWVELSFNLGAGEVVLHRAAIVTIAGQSIAAGR